jgi:hypothetical protein
MQAFDGKTEEIIRDEISRKYQGISPDTAQPLIDACVKACMEYDEERPYPEYIDGNKNRAVLRDYPEYGYDAISGTIFNIKSRQVFRPTQFHRITIRKNGKQYNAAVYVQGMEAFWPRPPIKVSVDHIDHTKGGVHILSNLRYANGTLQNSNKRKTNASGSTRAVIVTKNGVTTKFDSVWDFAKSINVKQTTFICKALKSGAFYKGYKVSYWFPDNTGTWRLVPPVFVAGVKKIWASEFGGWVRKPNGGFTQGYEAKSGQRSVAINGKIYKSHRLTCAAFHGLPPSDAHQANHILGVSNGPADAKDLVWDTPKQNSQHSFETGLNPSSRPVIMIDGNNKRIFASMMGAARELQEEGLDFKYSGINDACNGRSKTYRGIVWGYADEASGSSQSKRQKIFLDS